MKWIDIGSQAFNLDHVSYIVRFESYTVVYFGSRDHLVTFKEDDELRLHALLAGAGINLEPRKPSSGTVRVVGG